MHGYLVSLLETTCIEGEMVTFQSNFSMLGMEIFFMQGISALKFVFFLWAYIY